MTISPKKNRIIFIDLLRAIAVMQMVQGHTVDVLLSDNFRILDNPFYASWLFMRGLTAPVFMFTSGAVFTYLFRLVKQPFEVNPRVNKGIKRFFLLLFIGYIMKYPTSTLVDFSAVTPEQWKVFLAVDVLQLIGTSLFLVIVLAYISEKTKLGDYFTFGIAVILIIFSYPSIVKIQWTNYLPTPLAGYLYYGTGSLFPLFPWSAYVISGGILGSYLAKNPGIFKSFSFPRLIFLYSIAFMAAAFLGHLLLQSIYGAGYKFDDSFNLVFLRIGFVLIIISMVTLISIKVDIIPKIIILIGRNTLSIYIVHLVILYGSPWTPGLILIMDKSLRVWPTVGFALFMLSLMILMVIIINRLKIKNKQLVT